MYRRNVAFGLAAVAGCVASAYGQSELYAVSFGGDLFRLNTSTGQATLVGSTGFTRLNSMASDSAGNIYVSRGPDPGNPADLCQIVRLNRSTGAGTLVLTFPTNQTDIRGMAFDRNDLLYVIVNAAPDDTLGTLDLASGVITPIGAMGRGDFQGLTTAPFGGMYATATTSIGPGANGQVFSVNPATGATTVLGGALGMETQSIEFDRDGRVWSVWTGFRSVNLADGTSTPVGPGGLGDLRGLAAVVPAGGGLSCYANCDSSTQTPFLNVQDFTCFLQKYSAGCSAP